MTTEECLLHAKAASHAAQVAADPVTKAMYLNIAEAWVDLSQFVDVQDAASLAMLDLIRMMTGRLPGEDNTPP